MATLATLSLPTLHHEAVDWATRVVSNGGTASLQTIRAVSRFCRDIEAAGIRSKFTRLNLFVGASLSAALVPLYRSSSFGGSVVGNTTDTNFNFVAADWNETGTSSGLKGNGSTKYLDTGFNANTFAASNTHIGFGLVDAGALTTGYRAAAGVYGGGSQSLSVSIRTGAAGAENAACMTRFGTTTDTFGDNVGGTGAVLATGRIIAAYPTMYRNGSASGATASTSLNYPSAHRLTLFAINTSNVSIGNYSDARLNWYSFGQTMTAAQAAVFDAALARFNASLSRT